MCILRNVAEIMNRGLLLSFLVQANTFSKTDNIYNINNRYNIADAINTRPTNESVCNKNFVVNCLFPLYHIIAILIVSLVHKVPRLPS